ncbi:MAG: adenylate kinase [Bacteroidales bacterium]|nr:adenylate kinase [Bacteroidales bacterium]
MNIDKIFSVALFGAPGCGKGTQAALLAKHSGLVPISTGDLYRYEMSHDTELGLKAKEFINNGQLCPDSLTLDMLHKHLCQLPDSKGIILDGVPRTIAQAEMLDGIDYSHPVPISLVIYLTVDKDEVVRRILERAKISHRSDDTPEVAEQRIQNYLEQTAPLIDYYTKQGKLIEVNGMQTIEEVSASIFAIIDKHIK